MQYYVHRPVFRKIQACLSHECNESPLLDARHWTALKALGGASMLEIQVSICYYENFIQIRKTNKLRGPRCLQASENPPAGNRATPSLSIMESGKSAY